MTNYRFIKKDEIRHHGIQGQKWGERRWQYEDGTYTPEGRERYRKMNRKLEYTSKKVNALTEKIDKNTERANKAPEAIRYLIGAPGPTYMKRELLTKKAHSQRDKIYKDFEIRENKDGFGIQLLDHEAEKYDQRRLAFDARAKEMIETGVNGVFEHYSKKDIDNMYDTAYRKFIDYKKNLSEPDTFESFIQSLDSKEFLTDHLLELQIKNWNRVH